MPSSDSEASDQGRSAEASEHGVVFLSTPLDSTHPLVPESTDLADAREVLEAHIPLYFHLRWPSGALIKTFDSANPEFAGAYSHSIEEFMQHMDEGYFEELLGPRERRLGQLSLRVSPSLGQPRLGRLVGQL